MGIADQLIKLDPKIHPWLVVKLENIVDVMNTQVKELFELDNDFSFKNIISNRTKEEKVISEITPEFENAIQKFAIDKERFYSDKLVGHPLNP